MTECITHNDIAAMVAPISSELPVVGDLRTNISSSSSYQILRSARTDARNEERSARNEGCLSPIDLSNWLPILEQVPQVLQEESKDIELVAWYIEALTRFFGFRGLGYGFSLARQLIEQYGEQLFPQPDEEGLISQLSGLVGLNGSGSEGALIYPIKAILITEGDSPGPLAVWQCEQVLEVDRISDAAKKEARFKTNGLSRSQLDDVLMETSTPFLQQVQQDIQFAIESYEQYCQSLDAYCQDDPMPTGQIAAALESCLKTLTYIAGDRLQAVEVAEVKEELSGGDSAEKGVVKVDGPINDRDDALQRLREVAAYFRRTEPHSPISYSIEQAVRWSGLSLTELIKELIPDDGARTKYQSLSGIGGKADKE